MERIAAHFFLTMVPTGLFPAILKEIGHHFFVEGEKEELYTEIKESLEELKEDDWGDIDEDDLPGPSSNRFDPSLN